MDFERLEEFTVIARQKSIKKAGEILSVSPAALRARLEAFEASLGTALFLRQKDGLILTESGSRLYSNALSIVSRYHALKSELTFTDREKYHTLRIAVAGTQLPFYLEPFLGQLCKKYPDIHLDILDDRSFSIEEGLLNDHIDLYFAPAMKTNVCESISRFPLSSAHACIVLPSSHPLSPNASVSLKGLENETFILYPKTREECIRSFQLENLKASGIDFSVYDSETSPSFFHLLVSSGKGILLTPFHATKEIPGCTVIPVTNIPCPAPVTLFYKRSNTKPEIHHFITGFSKFIRETSSNEHRKTL